MSQERLSKEFNENDKIIRLLWCARHCCLCGKNCGIDIEFAHFPGKEESNNIDDAIPVCSECHIKIGSYNSNHPKGTKYKAEELKKRREQIYEEHTRCLVPPICFEITQTLPGGSKRNFPDVGFNITHIGNSLPVKTLVLTKIVLGDIHLKKLIKKEDHYSGVKTWNMNPSLGYQGHFSVADDTVKSNERLKIIVLVTIIDQYERHHTLLPVGWVYMREENSWFAEP